jgi:hypothetical protein
VSVPFEVWDVSAAPHGLIQIWETTVGGVPGYCVAISYPAPDGRGMLGLRSFVGHDARGNPATRAAAIQAATELGGRAGLQALVQIPGNAPHASA